MTRLPPIPSPVQDQPLDGVSGGSQRDVADGVAGAGSHEVADGVWISAEPLDGADGTRLRAELEQELHRRYGEQSEPARKPTAPDTTIFLVARDGKGSALGCAGLRRIDRETVEIKRMFVRPSARRGGVAAALLSELEQLALRLSARRIVLETGPRQPESIRLYERHGYRPIPCYGVYAGSRRSLCYARALPALVMP
jgi:GNAT superfamily N-acetyltransferase